MEIRRETRHLVQTGKAEEYLITPEKYQLLDELIDHKDTIEAPKRLLKAIPFQMQTLPINERRWLYAIS